MDPQATTTPQGLEADGLACVRGGRVVFRGLSLKLESGCALIVRGANGSGKSSLLRLLAGLLRPESGTIRLAGADPAEDPAAWRRKLVFLGHQDGLKPAETARVAIGFRARLYGRRAGLDGLRAMGMAELAGRPVRELSAGQRRRVALAAAMETGAPLWLFDEPSTALDEQGAALFRAALESHLRRGGMAVVTTHDPGGWPPACSELRLGA